MSHRIAVIGLGYVGLPVALGFAAKFPGTVGFDVDKRRLAALAEGTDWTHEVTTETLKTSSLKLTAKLDDLKSANVFIVCVPTPIHSDRSPDLGPLKSASEMVGTIMRRGAIVCYESTVYPGVTEEICGPILAQASGLVQGKDFKLGYSPERINPGDKQHTLQKIVKVVSGEDADTADTLGALYGVVVTAGIHMAPSIKVAETAKVLENTQRDLNIALMNELAIICDLLGIRTKDVLDAARTKWNFLDFTPGLVGGHCIGIDPYYLTFKARELGYYPEVILAGRRINDSLGAKIARRLVQLLSEGQRPLRETRVGILGLTFKENVPDIRNSRVFDIVTELKAFGIVATVHDPLADAEHVEHEYQLTLSGPETFHSLDALVLAVPHQVFLADRKSLYTMLRPQGVIIDVRSALIPAEVPANLRYWSL